MAPTSPSAIAMLSPRGLTPLDDPAPSYPTNAILNWQLPLNYDCLMTPAVAPDGTVYLPTGTEFWAVNPDMSLKWHTNFIAGYLGAPIIGADGTLYVTYGDPGIGLAALSPVDGHRLWSFQFDPYNIGISSVPALAPDGTVYIASPNSSSYGSTLFAITNGSVKWTYAAGDLDSFEDSAPVVASDGTIYVATPDRLLALRPDRSLKWVADPHGHALVPVSPAIASDGTIYYGTDEAFYAVKPNGTFKWTNSMPQVSFWFSPEIAADGTILVEGWLYGSNYLYALNSTNGSVKWTFPMSSDWGEREPWFKASSCAVAADGQIYVSDVDGTLYSLGPDGIMNWSYQTGAGGLKSPVLGPDGTIYVASYESGNLFSFYGTSPIACAPWPEYRRNSRHTAAVVSSDSSGHLSSPQMRTNGFQFTVNAPTNSVECICATRDLVNWTNLGQVVLTNGPANFLDIGASNYQYRFYRALPQ